MNTQRLLPPPADGMLAAGRPTGIIVSTVLTFAALYGGLIAVGITLSTLLGTQRMPFWAAAVAFGTALGVVLLWVKFKERRSLKSLGFSNPRLGAKRVARGLLMGFGFALATTLLLVATGQGVMTWQGSSQPVSAWAVLLPALLVFIVQSSTEEIFVRGFIMQAYARRFGLVFAIIGQAVVFAALHGENDGLNTIAIVNLLLVSVFLAFLSITEGGLWGACAFHACWNWAQSYIFGAAVSGQGGSGGIIEFVPAEHTSVWLSGGEFGPEASILLTALLALGIILLIRPFRAAVNSHPTQAPAREPQVA